MLPAPHRGLHSRRAGQACGARPQPVDVRRPSLRPRRTRRLQGSGMWAAIRAIHRAAHLTIAVSPAAAADLVGAGACDRGAVKVCAGRTTEGRAGVVVVVVVASLWIVWGGWGGGEWGGGFEVKDHSQPSVGMYLMRPIAHLPLPCGPPPRHTTPQLCAGLAQGRGL